MPHVRLSVRGPNRMGEAHHSFRETDQLEKAIETYHFRPRYALANLAAPVQLLLVLLDTGLEGYGLQPVRAWL